MATTSATAREVVNIPEFPELQLVVYGKKDSKSLKDELAQGYFVAHQGEPVPRCNLSDLQKSAVKAVLQSQFPQHALI